MFIIFIFIILTVHKCLCDSNHTNFNTTAQSNLHRNSSVANQCSNQANYISYKKVDCKDQYSCYGCQNIICDECEDVSCTSSYSCSRSDLNILGISKSAASVECKGPYSCAFSNIIAQNVKEVNCKGQLSCQGVRMDLECSVGGYYSSNSGCELDCSGSQSCMGATIVASSVESLSCSGNQACTNSQIHIKNSIYNSLKFTFDADTTQSAANSLISLSNVAEISCSGQSSCQNSVILISDIYSSSFTLICSGANSCANTKIDIQISSYKISHFAGIKCTSNSACKNSIISINSLLPVTIDYLSCDGVSSCSGLKLLLNNVRLFKQHCSYSNACDGLDIIIVPNVQVQDNRPNTTQSINKKIMMTY